MYSKILIPIEPGYGDEAHKAVRVARALLEPGGSIELVTVFLEVPYYYGIDLDKDLLERNEREAKAQIDADFGGPDVSVVIATGHPTRSILNLAQDGGHDCIVVASSQPGWGHVFLGSTAAGIVRHAHCSVHVLRAND